MIRLVIWRCRLFDTGNAWTKLSWAAAGSVDVTLLSQRSRLTDSGFAAKDFPAPPFLLFSFSTLREVVAWLNLLLPVRPSSFLSRTQQLMRACASKDKILWSFSPFLSFEPSLITLFALSLKKKKERRRPGLSLYKWKDYVVIIFSLSFYTALRWIAQSWQSHLFAHPVSPKLGLS
jgi:hypothetical protein